MRRSQVQKLLSLGVALVLASGCYSTKMMEFTYQELDTVKTTQKELLDRIHQLSAQLDEERQARVRAEAESAQTLRELREVLDILASRIDDTSQNISNRGAAGIDRRRATPPPTVPVPLDSAGGGVDSAGAGGDTLGVAPPAGGDNEPERLFKSAYMDLTLGNYDLAVQGFKNYLVRYPGSPNRDGSLYYLGESYYSLSRYLEAVAEYQSVIREYPRSRFVPAAYLKAGFCYQKLEEKQLAERAFRELIAGYPRSEEAQQARVALEETGG